MLVRRFVSRVCLFFVVSLPACDVRQDANVQYYMLVSSSADFSFLKMESDIFLRNVSSRT
jgi:hypothetical protein